MGKLIRGKLYLKLMLPALLTGVLVLDGAMGYVAPDPFDGLDIPAQTAYAAETPELELEEANAEKTVSKGPAGSLGDVDEDCEYEDGVYTGSARGFGGLIKVKVTIKDGRIKSIVIVSAAGETASYLSRASAVRGRIIKAQSTNVDAVSGATYSSNGIIKAVRNALAKAKKKKSKKASSSGSDDSGDVTVPDKPGAVTGGTWADGTYTGKGEGRNGTLHVSVTIADGKISAIELVDSAEDEEYIKAAIAGIFSSVTASQGTDVDAVTGATLSSYGLIEAINDALSQAAAAAGNSEDSGDDTGDDSGRSSGGGSGSEGGNSGDGKYKYKDGTYSVTGICCRSGWFDYDINIEFTVSSGKITSINITKGNEYTEDEEDQEENSEYLDVAVNGYGKVPGMKARILAAQSTDVDTVTGATYSSNAIKKAVGDKLSDIVVEEDDDNDLQAAAVQILEEGSAPTDQQADTEEAAELSDQKPDTEEEPEENEELSEKTDESSSEEKTENGTDGIKDNSEKSENADTGSTDKDAGDSGKDKEKKSAKTDKSAKEEKSEDNETEG